MSAAEGLAEAARVLREQAAFLTAKGHTKTASTLSALAGQFEALSRQASDTEPTDRQRYLGCPYCTCPDCVARRRGDV